MRVCIDLVEVNSPLNSHSNMLELGKESPKMEIFHGLPWHGDDNWTNNRMILVQAFFWPVRRQFFAILCYVVVLQQLEHKLI